MGAKRLSLLIPTLNNRSKLCERLTSKIIDQLTTEVEMMLLPDDGQRTIGEKRNALIEAAIGDYVAFIDDDDMISDDYIDQVMTAL
jgi:glycosyltransferase involved in cell wall biosynthesis